ncbi:MAG: Stealth CR1 domain-containing protein [Bacteroidaceae bacterium]|nr:Stealth CR1 domain-containing protein [Bacteroidaceae bacterium]
MDIDLVYLWVDGSDPAWQAKHNVYTGSTAEQTKTDCKGRYADNEELRYSLRSVEMYAPWIHHVFIVTDSQVPSWLDTSNPKVTVVDHRDILPAACLPCFNSALIEHFLYCIPGLAEHFLYANDDTFINQPVAPVTFFGSDGLPIMRMNRCFSRRLEIWFRTRILKETPGNYTMTIHNSAKLVQQKYGPYYDLKTHHNVDAYRKSNYEETHNTFRKEIEAMLGNHIRSAKDIQRNLYAFTALARKQAYLQVVTQRTSFRFSLQKMKHYKRMERYSPTFFCMNDSERVTDADRERAAAFLAKRFPIKSQFEK